MSLKVLFFSAREFGQPGTPGTYKFIEELSRFYTVRVISRPPASDSVYKNKKVPILPFNQGGENEVKQLEPIESATRQFAPDIIYVFQSTATPDVVRYLNELAPDAKILIDIKTPLLQKDTLRRLAIQQMGDSIIELVDKVITLSATSANTWFTKPLKELIVYPLAIDVDSITQRGSQKRTGGCVRHWVFASALHPHRKVAELLKGFACFLRENPKKAVLHIYGKGPDLPILQEYALTLGIEGDVCFHGLVPQVKLFRNLASYDAGIGWVPKDIFDDSPSLKVLEYVAAGLPVLATSTQSHLRLRDEGFQFEYCDDDAESLVDGFVRLIEKDRDSETIKANLDAVRMRSFSLVVQDHIVPIIESLGEELRENKALVSTQKKDVDDLSAYNSENKEMQPHRIMVIIEHLASGKGGAEKVASELACEMACRGHLVYLAYRDLGYPAYPINNNVVLVPFKSTEDLRLIVEGADIDVMTVFYFNRNLIDYVKLAELAGVPLVVQECTNPDRLRFRNWGRVGHLSNARSAWERELVTSVAARLRLVMTGYSSSFSLFQRPQIRAMPNGCLRTSLQARPDYSSEDRWCILIINGFKENKNLLDAVNAFSRLAFKYPNWVLRVVGKEPRWDSEFARKVARVLDKYALWERVEISEPTDDVVREFAAAHIHLISSLSEGCPTVVLEAMAVGLPSVGFEDCPGTNELIRHQENGLLAAAEDRVTGLAHALERLMSDASFRRELGDQARESAADFDPQHVYDQWEALLTEASEYRDDPDRLFREQYAIDPERALHARRMRHKILETR